MDEVEPYLAIAIAILLFAATIFFLHRLQPIKNLVRVILISIVACILVDLALLMIFLLVGFGDALSETPAYATNIIFGGTFVITPIFVRFIVARKKRAE